MNRNIIWKVIDQRSPPCRWGNVNALIEAVEHDNRVLDADQAPESDPLDVIDYDQREGVKVDPLGEQRSLDVIYMLDTFANEYPLFASDPPVVFVLDAGAPPPWHISVARHVSSRAARAPAPHHQGGRSLPADCTERRH
ncbi:hypothetical protein BES08_27705 (plasmid) [Novosphingobium resinovorum]|uniref:Uncharacterized protein n=1 Tax=Novosphingobium resinovorum TaxID=158500 RepID=A0A1D8AES7_9SPHN|nr:hypothetical protein BES08_27705 [Novosphingobium resinovorum]